MLTQLRGKTGAWIIGGIVGFIAFVFVFEGVFHPSATRGYHEGSVAGVVNGESITISDFNRALERKTEWMKQLTGGKVTEEQMKMFRLREGTFQELVRNKLMAQAAEDAGLEPSDEHVRQEIMKLPYFQKDGKFDVLAYKNILSANNMSAGSFENMMRDQIAVEEYQRSLAARVQVSDAEVKEEFLNTREQRNVKYVSLPAAAEKKGELGPKDLAHKIAGMLTASKGSDAAVNALVKPYDTEVRTTNLISKSAGYVPGIGEDSAIWNDVFASPSALEGKAKVYESQGRFFVVRVIESKRADLATFEKDRPQIYAAVKQKKENAIMAQAMKKLTEKAKIVPNAEVLGLPEEGAPAPGNG